MVNAGSFREEETRGAGCAGRARWASGRGQGEFETRSFPPGRTAPGQGDLSPGEDHETGPLTAQAAVDVAELPSDQGPVRQPAFHVAVIVAPGPERDSH